MAETVTLTLWNPQQAHQAMQQAWRDCIKPMTMAGHKLVVTIKPETRSLAQNRRLWAMLADVSEQVEWHGLRLSAEDWKHIFSAAQKKQRAVPGIDGGFVVLGQSTSKMTVAEMTELQELIEAFGTQQGVKFKAAPDEEV